MRNRKNAEEGGRFLALSFVIMFVVWVIIQILEAIF